MLIVFRHFTLHSRKWKKYTNVIQKENLLPLPKSRCLSTNQQPSNSTDSAISALVTISL